MNLSTPGVISGVCTSTGGVPLRGVTVWGCNLRGVNLRWVILRAPAALDHAVVAATVQQWRYHLATCVNASSLHLKHAL